MEASHLIWTEERRREAYRSKVLTVQDTECRSPEGILRPFTVIDCADWVIVVPVFESAAGNTAGRRIDAAGRRIDDAQSPSGRQFLMVRQWRHGSRELSLEFPGGVLEDGEDPQAGAGRELKEETAYQAGRLTRLGTMSPNPAIMSNHVHFYLAENCIPLPRQNLDEDEFVDAEFIHEKEALSGMGKPPYIHALTAAALSLYLTYGMR